MVVDGNRKRTQPSVQVGLAADNIEDDGVPDDYLTVHPSEVGFSINGRGQRILMVYVLPSAL